MTRSQMKHLRNLAERLSYIDASSEAEDKALAAAIAQLPVLEKGCRMLVTMDRESGNIDNAGDCTCEYMSARDAKVLKELVGILEGKHG